MQKVFGELPRWIRTVRHLRSSQVVSRTGKLLKRRLRLERGVPLPAAERVTSAVVAEEEFPEIPLLHLPAPGNEQLLDQLSRGIFELNNQTRTLGMAPTNWLLGPQRTDRLWAINLHYQAWAFRLSQQLAHGDAPAERAGVLLKQLLDDWFWNCRPDDPQARHLAWNSFAVATRISWWIRSLRIWPTAFRQSHPQLERMLLCSLWQHAEFLSHHLEWDLRGNHLLRDAVGLAWAGRFFRGRRPSRWMHMASQLADSQMDEQVLSDGGHFERSPMYHVHIMEDVLALYFLIEDPPLRAKLRAKWEQMADCLAWLRHPDGEVPLFNDAAMDAVPHPNAMLRAAPHLGLARDTELPRGGRHLEQFGMVVWHGEPWSLFFDVGFVGPDFQPGHAHADTLSFVGSYRGMRLFVDPGTHSYDHDQRRMYDRSTTAHNTVAIDEQPSSEVWHIFRVGRRAKPLEVRTHFDDHSFEASAGHDGYDHLAGRPRHHRTIQLAECGNLQIIDHLQGGGTHQLSGGLLVAPGWNVQQSGDTWQLEQAGHSLRVRTTTSVPVESLTESRPYHPRYGVEEIAQRLSWRTCGPLPITVTTTVTPLN